ncbi:unnamed protein product [Heligmosomoides polygyrus]|uniref:YcaO domain-containing protein n=1 Tax=Heligmosomoides polygyrus TaxID=6339 RepID=A0A183F9M0_HELPZ|nr:unnamed protein product [Heligmosomoides polygyrus]
MVVSDSLHESGVRERLNLTFLSEIEPRLLRSSGPVSAQPVYVVGIYKDKTELVGQSAGETLEIAVDMAAREALLRLWGITADRVFFFGKKAEEAPLEQFSKPNYSLKERCRPRYVWNCHYISQHC